MKQQGTHDWWGRTTVYSDQSCGYITTPVFLVWFSLNQFVCRAVWSNRIITVSVSQRWCVPQLFMLDEDVNANNFHEIIRVTSLYHFLLFKSQFPWLDVRILDHNHLFCRSNGVESFWVNLIQTWSLFGSMGAGWVDPYFLIIVIPKNIQRLVK